MGKRKPGIFSSWSMQEILPISGPAGLTWPPVLGKLSRRLPSDCDVQNTFPVRNGLVGNSRMCLFPSAVSAEFLNPLRVHWIAENFKDSPIPGNQGHCVPLIGVHPDIPLPIEGDAVPAFENRMSDEDIAEAQRVVCECGVTACRTFEVSIPVEFYLP